MWSSLPSAILRINAYLAIAAAENSDFDEAGKQQRLMYSSGFGEEHARQEIVRCLSPLRDEVERLCESAENEARSNPRVGLAVVQNLLTDKDKLLHAFNYLLGAGEPICDTVHDRVAEAGRMCLVAYVTETNDWSPTRRLLEECLALAEGKALRSMLENDLDIIAGNIAAGRHSRSTASSNTAVKVETETERPTGQGPFQSGRRIAKRNSSTRRRLAGAIAVGAVVLLVAVRGCEDSSSPSPPYVQAHPSNPYPQSSGAEAQGVPTTSTPAGSRSAIHPENSSELEGLKAQINTDEATLAKLKDEIEQSQSSLNDLKTQLHSDKIRLDEIQQDHDLGLSVNVDEYERIRHRYNANVDIYNTQVREYNSELADFKQLATSTKAEIDKYNSLVGSQ